jgi:hypothetical protein
MPLGRSLMAQNRSGTGSEQSGPEHRLPGWIPGEGGVHAALQPLPATAANPGPHGLGVDAQVPTLTSCDGGRLGLQVLREGFGGHSLIVQSRSDSCLPPPEPVDNSDPWRLSVDN